MKEEIKLHDLTFVPYISKEEIALRVEKMSVELNKKYKDKCPVFMIMLKGAYAFGADLVRQFRGDCEVTFVRAQSYHGTETTHKVQILLPPKQQEVEGRHVVIVEDIVDSGNTMADFIPLLHESQPASVALISLFVKPDKLEKEVEIDQIGFSIGPKFIVGYGLDYDGLGRNLNAVYQLKE